MEDGDDFGDLYADVLTTFPSSPPLQQQQPPTSSSSSVPPPPRSFDAGDILSGAPNSDVSDQNLTLPVSAESPASGIDDSGPNSADDGVKSRERELGKDVKFGFGDSERAESMVFGKAEERCEDHYPPRAGVAKQESGGLQLQESSKRIGDVGCEPIITEVSLNEGNAAYMANQEIATTELDEWGSSDSEDDLHIVLNDHSQGPAAPHVGGDGEVDEDEDEDDAPLVIVGNSNEATHVKMEEPEWSEDTTQSALDGERKDTSDVPAKMNGGTVNAQKVGYNNHEYLPFLSQFKYIRPGASLMPGAAATGGPGQSPGQVRPVGNMTCTGGRGRGDWRPPGRNTALSMQKNCRSSLGVVSGRGFSGRMEFTLPSHKTIFDVDINGIEEKPWKLPGGDISDFFNFGLDEDKWKGYCRQLEHLLLEGTMQSKIRVYESGRREQEYDPDLPLELAAAASIHDVTAESANAESDAGQGGTAKESARIRPLLPTGRAIQVEGCYSERPPSYEIRQSRMCDFDAIIEIVLQDSVDDTNYSGNGILEQPNNNPQLEDSCEVQNVNTGLETVYGNDFSHTHISCKQELIGSTSSFMNNALDHTHEGEKVLSFASNTPNEERQTDERTCGRLSHAPPNQKSQDKRSSDNQNEDPVNRLHLSSSPTVVGIAGEEIVEQNKHILADGSPQTERDYFSSDGINSTGTDGHLPQHVKEQKLPSEVEQPMRQENNDTEAKNRESRKERSGNSRTYQKGFEGNEECVQENHLTCMANGEGNPGADELNFKRHNPRAKGEAERNFAVVKLEEESLSHSTHHSGLKTEGLDRQKKKDACDGAWQKRNVYIREKSMRADGTRKWKGDDEMGPSHRGKLRKSDKDEHLQSGKHMNNGSLRGHHGKELGSRYREKYDNLNSLQDNVVDFQSKRRKGEYNPKRDHADREILQGHRENTNRQKRERDEVMDHKMRDDQARIRDNPDEHHTVRHKDNGWLQREGTERQRDGWHSVKQAHEEFLPMEEREGRGALRNGQGEENKAWAARARVKDKYISSDKDYPIKDTGRNREQHRGRDQIEDVSLSIHRGRADIYPPGNQLNSKDRRSRQERMSTRNDRVLDLRFKEKRLKANRKKSKGSESTNQNDSAQPG